MSILNIQKSGSQKGRTKRILTVGFGSILIIVFSFFAYLYATGSKVFDGQTGLFDIIKGEQSDAFKEDRINILIVGRGGENHPGPLLTDSIMVLSVKPKDKKAAILSMPRDLYIPIKGHGSDKINSAYADGYNDYLDKSCHKKKTSDCKSEAMAAGANLTRATVSEVLGIPIHFYISGDFEGFKKIVDKLGGLDIVVEKTLYDPLYPDEQMKGYSPFLIKAGKQHINGETALKYTRSRETTSDFDRAKRQQQILQAMKDKAFQLGILSSPKSILDIIKILGDHLRTDLSPTDLKTLAELMKSTASIVNKVLDSSSGGPLVSDNSSGTYYLKTRTGNYLELREIAGNIFEDQSKVLLNIELINGSGISSNGANLAASLRKLGYSANVSSAEKGYKTTIIYRYVDDAAKNKAIDDIGDSLNATVIEQVQSSAKFDLLIKIGEDYTGLK